MNELLTHNGIFEQGAGPQYWADFFQGDFSLKSLFKPKNGTCDVDVSDPENYNNFNKDWKLNIHCCNRQEQKLKQTF